MRVEQEKVEIFMVKIGDPIAEKPEVGDFADGSRRYNLMLEELTEYLRALENGDLVEIADALADLAYTVLGTNAHHGIDAQPIFDEVHRSNMTKERCFGNAVKLCRKGDGFEKPRVAELLLIQSTGVNE